MASILAPNTVLGDIILIDELSKHLRFKRTEKSFLRFLATTGSVAVESMLEAAISKIGKLKRSNKHGEDFTDGSDAKKGIVNDRFHGPNRGSSREVSICNLKNKKGKLRIMIAEPKSGEIFYFVIPKKEYKGQDVICFQFNRHGGKNTNFSTTTSQSWRIWNRYRRTSFRAMCH